MIIQFYAKTNCRYIGLLLLVYKLYNYVVLLFNLGPPKLRLFRATIIHIINTHGSIKEIYKKYEISERQ